MLHLTGIAQYAAGAARAGGDLLERAAQLERIAGDTKAAHHSVHQINLLNHLKGDMQRLASYYTDSMRTLKTARNLEGLALCLKTLGLMAVVQGDRRNAGILLEKSAGLMKKCAMDAGCVSEWAEMIKAEAPI